MPCAAKCYKFLDAVTQRKELEKTSSSESNLRKCLTVIDLTAIGVSSTLGAGLYVLAGDVARNTAGPGIVVSFLIAGFASILSALCYTEFASKVPKAGTAYVYSYIMIGELIAFIIGWNLVLEFVIGAASIARGFSSYINSLFDGIIRNTTHSLVGDAKLLGITLELDFVSFFLCLLISVVLSTGVKYGSRFNIILTGLNLLIVLLVVIIGLFYIKLENWSSFAPFGISGIIDGASTCFFAFIGFDVIVTTAEEAKNPSKTIPVSIISTIGICSIAYFGVSAILTLMVPYHSLAGESALISAFDTRGVSFGKYIIGTGAGISLCGGTIASLLPLPRLLYAMAMDGLLPTVFSKVNGRTNVPVFSTLFSGLFSGFMAFLLDLHDLVEMLSIGTLMAYSIVTICVLFLRYDKMELKASSTPSQFDVARKNITESDKQALFSYDDALQAEETYDILKESMDEDDRRTKTTFAKGLICLIVLQITGLCWMFSTFQKMFFRIWILFPFVLLVVGVLSTTVILAVQKQADQEMPFRVPLVPFLPVISLLCNIYLIMRLNKWTWVRFVVWLVIGLIIYFCYGVWHGVNRNDKDLSQPGTGYIPLKALESESTDEEPRLYPSLKAVSKEQ